MPPLSIPADEIVATQPDLISLRDTQRLNPFLRLAEDILKKVSERQIYNCTTAPSSHALRGIDFYQSDAERVFALATSLNRYSQNHLKLPDFFDPQTATEKLLVMKMFAAIPKGPPADKLLAENFVPSDILALLSLVRRHWISAKPDVPSNDLVLPGRYFLKTNFGAGNNIAVEYPLAEQERLNLLGKVKTWFERRHRHGFWAGEWWYQTIVPRVYLEEDLSEKSEDIADWKFWVAGGQLQFVQVDQNRSSAHIQRVYDRNFAITPHELYYPSDFKGGTKPSRFNDMVTVAESISKNLEFARIDFFVKRDEIFLGEITLCPFGAKKRMRSQVLDESMGQGWRGTALFPN